MKNKLFLICLTIFLYTQAFAQQETAPTVATEAGAELFKKVDPSVVAIQIEKAGGSGMIVSSDGYIITNGHVISNATRENPLKVSKKITVILNDESKYSATYIGHCMDPDVALIKIEPKHPLSIVTFADSSKVQTGQKSYALGMPVGHKRTLTSGIISNTERTIGTYTAVFQTDAAINPGNSGGPLFNEQGEVIGINTYAGGGQNIGFTIPSNVVLTLKEHFMKYGYFKRAIVPFFFTSQIYEELGNAFGGSEGVMIDYVEKDSLADKAGMRRGDIVIEKNGKKVAAHTLSQLLQFEWEMATQDVGSELNLKLKRKVNEEFVIVDFKATMIEDEPNPTLDYYQRGELRELFYPELGLGVTPLVTISKYILGLTTSQGVLVSQAISNFPAERAGLVAKNNPDLITHLNGTPIVDIKTFESLLNKALETKQKIIPIRILRNKLALDTALKPSYRLAKKSVAIIITNPKPTHWKEVIHFAYSTGLNTEIFSLTGKAIKIEPSAPREETYEIKTHETLEKLDVSKFDSLLLIDGNGTIDPQAESFMIKNLKTAINSQKLIAAIGATSLWIYKADPSIKNKITTAPALAEAATELKANYTGKDVENDGKIITCTGVDEDIVRDFLNKMKDTLQK